MQTPANPFKNAIAQRQPQIGLWMGLANAYCAEICAGAGFDWLLVDGEHAPSGLSDILAQLQAIAAYPGSHAIARVPVGEAALIKQYLDLGVQTLLVPMVDTPEQAAALVRACRYPQDDGLGGIRGMAGARASRWGRYPQYAKEANAPRCRTWTRLPPPPAWTACSSARPTCLPRWAMSATPTTPKCRPPSKTPSRAS
jgi:4-hydroxy-2-oxoheptanedioate aldolase